MALTIDPVLHLDSDAAPHTSCRRTRSRRSGGTGRAAEIFRRCGASTLIQDPLRRAASSRKREDGRTVVPALVRWMMSAAASGRDSIKARPRSAPRTLMAVSSPSASRPCRAMTVTVMSSTRPIPEDGSMMWE